jgi:hypothetical protein
LDKYVNKNIITKRRKKMQNNGRSKACEMWFNSWLQLSCEVTIKNWYTIKLGSTFRKCTLKHKTIIECDVITKTFESEAWGWPPMENWKTTQIKQWWKPKITIKINQLLYVERLLRHSIQSSLKCTSA